SIHRIEFGSAFQRIGKSAKLLAYRGCAGGQRSRGHMPIKISSAGDRTLTSDVEGGERIHLPGMWYADDHPELLLYGRIGSRRLHTAVFERRPRVLVEIGQDRGGLDGGGRETQRRLRAHGARYFGDRGAILGNERAGDPVIRAHAVDIMLHD